MIFTDYWKGLVLNFSVMGYMVFFWMKKLIEDDIYWLLRSSCFELFGDRKYGLFFRQNVDGKMIFTWSFCAFYDISGPWKYSFSRSEWRNLWTEVRTTGVFKTVWIQQCKYIFFRKKSSVVNNNWEKKVHYLQLPLKKLTKNLWHVSTNIKKSGFIHSMWKLLMHFKEILWCFPVWIYDITCTYR